MSYDAGWDAVRVRVFGGLLDGAGGTFSGTVEAAAIVASDSFTANEATFSNIVRAQVIKANTSTLTVQDELGTAIVRFDDGLTSIRILNGEPIEFETPGSLYDAIIINKDGNNDDGRIIFQQGGPTGNRFELRHGAHPSPLEFWANGDLDFVFDIDGTGRADTDWVTFSPEPPKAVDLMTARDWLAWSLEDATKPVKPYRGIPTEDHPVVLEIADATGRDPFEVMAEERGRYEKSPAKIAIGTARWAEGDQQWRDDVMTALAAATDFATFKATLAATKAL